MTNMRTGHDSDDHFDLCIVGTGSGLSLVDDDFDDWRIAVIDNGIGPTNAFGGTCLNAGCIPSKMLAVPAGYALAGQAASRVDVSLRFGGADFHAVQARTFGRTDAISEAGLAGLERRGNVRVLRGSATFSDAHTLRVGHERISADRIVLAAGSRPRLLDAPGFDDPYLAAFVHTSESIMRIEDLPKRMIIIGGGVEAVEFASIFAGFGVHVSVVSRSGPLLRRYDSDIARVATEALAERVVLRLNQQVSCLDSGDTGGVVLTTLDSRGIEYSYGADAVLVCTGRIPNGDQLRLDRAGVAVDDDGFVVTDQHLRTGVDHIWALGDICSPDMLKHLANQQARVVKLNLLAERDGGELVSSDEWFVPQGIFGEPEIAVVGSTEAELARAGTEFVSHVQQFGSVAYGWAMNDVHHFVKLLGDLDGQVLGAHIIGPGATVLIQPILMGLAHGLDAHTMARGQYWIHPSISEVVENALLGLARAADDRRAGR